MGWKTLKERFGIEHQVCVYGGNIAIGSPLVSNIVEINPATGKIVDTQSFVREGFLEKNYPCLANATDADRLAAIQAQDTFERDIPVFSFCDGNLIETFCEEPGYPNVTHCGKIMFENRFTTDRNVAVQWAKDDLICWRNSLRSEIARLQGELDKKESEYGIATKQLEVLDLDYPDVQPTVKERGIQ